MRKSTIFISTILTTFALVMLYSVVSAYRGNKNVTQAEAASAQAPTATAAPTDAPTPTAVTPEEAAQIAAQVVGKTNLLSAESASLNGVDAYKITFTNNDVVYVSLDGQILSVQIAPVVVNVAPPVKKNHKENGGGSPAPAAGNNNSNNEQHEGQDD